MAAEWQGPPGRVRPVGMAGWGLRSIGRQKRFGGSSLVHAGGGGGSGWAGWQSSDPSNHGVYSAKAILNPTHTHVLLPWPLAWAEAETPTTGTKEELLRRAHWEGMGVNSPTESPVVRTLTSKGQRFSS